MYVISEDFMLFYLTLISPILNICNFVQLLGINIFTYVLAAAIAFFFSMNVILGPGWLGNSIGLEGTGTFEKVSDSLPDTIDLSYDDYLI